MEIEQKIVNITEIKENKDNPRKISKSQLERLKLSLQNAYLYRKCFIDNRFSFNAKYISDGGLASERNKNEIQKNIRC